MVDHNEVPKGFVTLSDPEAHARQFIIVDADKWQPGFIVVYHGAREWKSATGELHRVHTVAMEPDDGGALSAIWGTVKLDRLFKLVSVGERVFLRYDGKAPHPTLPTQHVHQWTVARATTDADPAPVMPVPAGSLL